MTHAWGLLRADGGCAMPAYTFEIKWDGGEKLSWTYLPTDDSANKFARLLIRDFKDGDQYRGRGHLVVKNNEGTQIASIAF
jgi:hypothetical protein